MSLKHRKVITVADDPAAAGKLRPSDWGSTSTNYDTAPTHVFSGGADGALARRDVVAVDGFSWLPSAAGVLVSDGDDEIPVFRPLQAADIPALPYAPIDLTGFVEDADIVSLAWGKLTDVPAFGDAALLNVGTVAGTVAAGDHLHAGVYEPVFGTLGVAKGGTGLAAFTAGDLVYASGAATLAKLAAGAAGAVLVSGGAGLPPVWSSSPTFTGAMTTSVDAIGVTSTDGFVLQNTTPATVGIPLQISPRLRWRATGWDTDDAVSRTMNWWAEVTGASGTSLVSIWRLLYQLDAGGAATPFQLTNAGALTITGGLTCTNVVASGVVQAGASNFIGWAGLTRLVATVNAQLQLWNNALTVGVGLDFSTNAVLKVRTTGQSAYATVDALGYSVSGVAGASKAAGPVTSITVVNGIVTAIS